ncbi:hypothetical protein L218DRAFT_503456 [Marasmius fiardii PR-910]|nr:hypothetical protein L218DRAFT_503456 [Marasmius fiardii PR-910]
MLDSMPEDEAEPNTCGQKSVTTNKSRESTPLTEDEEPVDDDDPNDPDVQPPASLKKGGIGATKRATRGRKAASGNGSAAGSKTRTKSKKANEEDVDMAGSDEEGAAMEV